MTLSAPQDKKPEAEPRAGRDVLGQIRALVPSLRPADARVGEVILGRAQTLGYLSVTEVAAEAGVAESTVVRACQRMGFGGFQDVKRLVARGTQPAADLVYDDISAADDSSTVLEKVVASSAAVLSDCLATVDRAAFAAAARAIAGAGRLLLVGVGPSSPIAQDAAYRFRMLGLPADAPVDALTQHLAARHLGPRGVCVAISHTGATRETLAAMSAARESEASTIAITSFTKSPLTGLVDHPIIAGGRGTSYRVEAMASRLAHLAVVDALYVEVAFRGEERALVALDQHHQVAAEHQL
ncbi:DNA-binding MurR/RpiR family transcriptional regulator [Amycolatopsis bartoniae]|uniref:RpiR family transcriptional regulator n=1 Tax=Amycolatopsis bartoniae TaxID=941986 RepID=A0A8H9IW02_9PSEU|nr:MurR/RpiR family transcriptional regulator [Amycolatopsis bartoniae]MBB2933457.1 DNA-binding MurR/RpiR family transcriptional regulator [Amycolatopsis bartoniae]TVT00409.1 MurR/RpiR family transcriptional regulator [Amycolatopsis bartoniae]GHF59589.1 RpiR family transcriptional regulator [Amycolatopsis bartoniae]